MYQDRYKDCGAQHVGSARLTAGRRYVFQCFLSLATKAYVPCPLPATPSIPVLFSKIAFLK